MNLLLICETAIIEQIFSLVCKKLDINLTVSKSNDVSENYDLIIVDQNFIDDKFNTIKQFSKKLGAISSEELPFDKSRDFIIPRPFLPTKLQEIIKKEVENIIKSNELASKEETSKASTYIDTNEYEDTYIEDREVRLPIVNDDEFLNEDDESIVTMPSHNKTGILDNIELSKINDILNDDIVNEIINKKDLQDISNIIDEELDKSKDYEFDLNESKIQSDKSLKLVLSDYDIDDLKPLLKKFNQVTIDKLSYGESIDITLVLKENS